MKLVRSSAVVLLGSLAIATVASRAPAQGTGSTKLAKLLAVNPDAQATMAACVADAVAQKIPLRVASTLCTIELGGVADKGFGAGAVGSFGGRTVEPARIVSACSAGVDPKLGKERPYGGVGDGTLDALEKSTRDQAAKEKDPAVKGGLLAEADKMRKEFEYREETNTSVPDKKRTAEGGACAAVTQAARELLRECNRTAWKAAPCQELAAKMNGCPSPTLILVDPDAGYACGASADPKAVADAWRKKCEQVVKTVPGATPCGPVAPMGGDPRLYGGGQGPNVCADPRALVEGDTCFGPLTLPKPLQPGVDEVIVMGSRLGGPIVVLPPRPKPAGPRPEPRPGPKTGPIKGMPSPISTVPRP